MNKKNEQRKNAATNVAAGGALLAGAAGASYVNDRALERRGLQPPVKTVMSRGKLKPAHARYGAAKLGVRGLQVTGIPLAAYGAYNLVKPDEKVKRVSAKDDIAKPIARGVTFRDAADERRKAVAKNDARKYMTEGERKRTRAAATGVIGGAYAGLGGGAAIMYSGTRDAKRAALLYDERLNAARARRANRGRKAISPPLAEAKRNRSGVYNIRSEEKKFSPRGAPETPARLARRASRKIGGGIGLMVGAPLAATATALTVARRNENRIKQRKAADLASRQVAKALFRTAYVKGIGRVRVVGSPKKDYFDVVDSRDQRRLVPRSRITPLPQRQVKKADRFLREYRDRISPNAEAGYDSMRRQRNKDRAWAVTQGGLTGVNAAGLAAALKSRSKVWTPVTAATTAFSGSQAVRHGRKARGYDKGPMEGIRRKAKDRERQGLYAPGRGREPVDETSRQFGKAAMPRPRSVPKGMLRRPTIRSGHVARRPRGRMVSVRGSFG